MYRFQTFWFQLLHLWTHNLCFRHSDLVAIFMETEVVFLILYFLWYIWGAIYFFYHVVFIRTIGGGKYWCPTPWVLSYRYRTTFPTLYVIHCIFISCIVISLFHLWKQKSRFVPYIHKIINKFPREFNFS